MDMGTSFRAFTKTRSYNVLTAAPLVAWFALLVFMQSRSLAGELSIARNTGIDLLSATHLLARCTTLLLLVLWIPLLLARLQPVAKAPGFHPRLAAWAGTFLGTGIVLLPDHPLAWELNLLATMLVIGGAAFAVYSILSLGRSVSIMAEARRLVTHGPYARIRHPLYLGEEIVLLGITLEFISPWALALLACQWAFQLRRMGYEERTLKGAFPEYEIYMERTSRLIPGVY
jgi:protein-S-isoprenylcysteine O-methyltransferase Ste14